MLVVSPPAQLLSDSSDGVGHALVQQPELGVGACRGLLHGAKRLDQRRKLANGDAGNWKVLRRAQGLDAVQCVVWHVAFAEQVVLGSRTSARKAKRPPATH